MGALLLIFGFLGFNASSQLSLSKPGDGVIVTTATFNTLLAGSSGALTSLFLNRFLPFWGNYWSYLTMVNGAVAGMAAICAGCCCLESWAALVTGCLGGIAFIGGRSLLEKIKGTFICSNLLSNLPHFVSFFLNSGRPNRRLSHPLLRWICWHIYCSFSVPEWHLLYRRPQVL